ncbi:hypothetical protein HUU53_00940 [Candidatus Micrarchaeota archaeon]|nr:hypothetical protein [Candidatus Micrarchaeota archaeon]
MSSKGKTVFVSTHSLKPPFAGEATRRFLEKKGFIIHSSGKKVIPFSDKHPFVEWEHYFAVSLPKEHESELKAFLKSYELPKSTALDLFEHLERHLGVTKNDLSEEHLRELSKLLFQHSIARHFMDRDPQDLFRLTIKEQARQADPKPMPQKPRGPKNIA